MEGQLVRRRANIIAAHLASPEDISTSAAHIVPMSCSSTLNSAIQRCDNKLFFARQCSSSQARFMRQISSEQESSTTMPFKSTGCGGKVIDEFEAPSFSRPFKGQATNLNVAQTQSTIRGYRYARPSSETPRYARPNEGSSMDNQLQSIGRAHAHLPNGKWSPRMDVTECRLNYVITVELPGVSADEIKVEVSDQILRVTGNRSNQWCKAASCSNELFSSYHRREISQGSYNVVWPLPINADKDNISAEFVNGFLQITVPKLQETRCMKKACM